MNNKWTLRTQLNEIGWLAVLFATVGATVALRYLTGLPGTQWWQYYMFSGLPQECFSLGIFYCNFCWYCRCHDWVLVLDG